MKNLTKGEKIFLVYSIINIIIIWCAVENVDILNGEIAVGVFLSWMMYIVAYMIISSLTPILEENK